MKFYFCRWDAQNQARQRMKWLKWRNGHGELNGIMDWKGWGHEGIFWTVCLENAFIAFLQFHLVVFFPIFSKRAVNMKLQCTHTHTFVEQTKNRFLFKNMRVTNKLITTPQRFAFVEYIYGRSTNTKQKEKQTKGWWKKMNHPIRRWYAYIRLFFIFSQFDRQMRRSTFTN